MTIDLNNADRYLRITKEKLLSTFSDFEIFRHYFGSFETSKTYKSPLRRKDDNPSFNIFYSNEAQKFMYKDFAGSTGDCIRFVQELHNLKSYNDAVQEIYRDMSSMRNETAVIRKEEYEAKSSRSLFEIRIVARKWEARDFAYWRQFGIGQATLDKFNVVPINGYYHNKFYIQTDNITYAYLEYKDNKLSYKIYRPTAPRTKKWRNNHPFTVHQGYRQLPIKGELLVITKSLKDVMSLYECAHIPAIGVQSETCFIKQQVVDEYLFRFDRVLTLFDNDEQGLKQAVSYYNMYGIASIFIPIELDCKDFSDLVREIGCEKATKVLKDVIEVKKRKLII